MLAKFIKFAGAALGAAFIISMLASYFLQTSEADSVMENELNSLLNDVEMLMNENDEQLVKIREEMDVTEKLNEIGSGNFGVRVEVTTSKEFKNLSARINNMVDNIKNMLVRSENVNVMIKGVVKDIEANVDIVEATAQESSGESRNLANSAVNQNNTADEISDLLKNISAKEKSQTGVKIAKETSEKILEVVENINKSTSLAEGIAASSGEQTAAVMQLSEKMDIIAKSIDETSLLAERVTGESEKLQTNAVDMSELMKKLSEIESEK